MDDGLHMRQEVEGWLDARDLLEVDGTYRMKCWNCGSEVGDLAPPRFGDRYCTVGSPIKWGTIIPGLHVGYPRYDGVIIYDDGDWKRYRIEDLGLQMGEKHIWTTKLWEDE